MVSYYRHAVLVEVGLDKATIKLDYSHSQTRVKFGSRKTRLFKRADAKISTQTTLVRRLTQQQLEKIIACNSKSQQIAKRAKIILLAAQGKNHRQVEQPILATNVFDSEKLNNDQLLIEYKQHL